MGHTPDKKATGFVALSSLVSAIEKTLEQAKSMENPPKKMLEKTPVNDYSKTTSPQRAESSYFWEKFFEGRTCACLFAITIIMITFGFFSTSSNSKTPHKQPSSSSSTIFTPAHPVPSAKKDIPLTPSVPSFEEPPVGEGRVLSTPQIQWCLREKICLETMDLHINRHNEEAIKRFNVLVDDYNNRCGHYKYRENSMVSAKNNVESLRNEIIAQAILVAKIFGKKAAATPSHASTATSTSRPSITPAPRLTPVPAKPTSTIKQPPSSSVPPASTSASSGILTKKQIMEIQRLLRDLGHSPSAVDGKIGPDTKKAVKAFYKSLGIKENGTIDQVLLFKLNFEKTKRKK